MGYKLRYELYNYAAAPADDGAVGCLDNSLIVLCRSAPYVDGVQLYRLIEVCMISLRSWYLRCDMSTNSKIFSSRSCCFFTKK
jgi:hypothetical protein